MSEGSRCKATPGGQPGDFRASSVVDFICDTSVPGFGNPQLLASLPPGNEETACAFLIEWKTSVWFRFHCFVSNLTLFLQYACPTFENGGFWRFMTTLIVMSVFFVLPHQSFTHPTHRLLVLSMTYTILGTLYNRFVLDLRGYDQIPQFSFESMKYHLKEGFEWTKDMAGILFVNFFNHSPSSMPSSHPRTPNPVSHHVQVSGMGNNHDLEQGASPADQSVFIRPHASHKSPVPLQRPLTNPVSHHTQTLSLSQSPPPHQPTPQLQSEVTTPTTQHLGASSGSTDREFILVDDGDVEELETRPPPPDKPGDVSSRDNSQATSANFGVAEPDTQDRLS